MNFFKKIFGFRDSIKEHFVYNPKEDITASELSQLIPLIVNHRFSNINSLKIKIDLLPREVSRHLILKKIN